MMVAPGFFANQLAVPPEIAAYAQGLPQQSTPNQAAISQALDDLDVPPPPRAHSSLREFPGSGPTPRSILPQGPLSAPAAPSVQVTAPPAAAQMQPDDTAAIMRRLYGQQGGGTVQRAGLQPSDVGYLGREAERAGSYGEGLRRIADEESARVEDQANQSRALADDAFTARAIYQEGQNRQREQAQKIQADYERSQQRVNSELDRLQAEGINPERYYQNMSTGTKVLAGIAVALGEFGSHPLGPRGTGTGHNTALSIIQNAVMADVDAQKANLAKAMDLAKQRGLIGAQDAQHRMALLAAERDSVTAGFNVAMRQIDQQANLYRDSQAFQQKATQLKAGLLEAANGEATRLNKEIYDIQRASERLVSTGAGGDLAKRIRERAIALADKAAEAGHEMTPQEAFRRATLEMTGADVGGGAPLPSYAKERPGAKEDVKAQQQAAQLQALAQGVGSTSYNPLRSFQETKAYAQKNANEQWNSMMMGLAHSQFGIRNPDAMEHVMAPYLIRPGDNASTVKMKRDAALRQFGDAALQNANPAGLEPDETP